MATSTTSKKDFPVELWLRVFGHLNHDDACGRPKRINAYKKALADGATETEASRELPLFERQFWAITRGYYAISRNSRAAASRLQLTERFMSSCRRPVMIASALAHHCDLSNLKELMPSPPAVIQLLHRSTLDDSSLTMRPGRIRHRTMSQFISNRISCEIPLLDDVNHMILLPPSPRSCDCCPDWYLLEYAVCAKDIIEDSRRSRGVPEAKVEFTFEFMCMTIGRAVNVTRSE